MTQGREDALEIRIVLMVTTYIDTYSTRHSTESSPYGLCIGVLPRVIHVGEYHGATCDPVGACTEKGPASAPEMSQRRKQIGLPNTSR
jgi:hypothetical protein